MPLSQPEVLRPAKIDILSKRVNEFVALKRSFEQITGAAIDSQNETVLQKRFFARSGNRLAL